MLLIDFFNLIVSNYMLKYLDDLNCGLSYYYILLSLSFELHTGSRDITVVHKYGRLNELAGIQPYRVGFGL
jgi:hypothetical protein